MLRGECKFPAFLLGTAGFQADPRAFRLAPKRFLPLKVMVPQSWTGTPGGRQWPGGQKIQVTLGTAECGIRGTG